MRKATFFLLIGLLVVILVPQVSVACPGCNAIENGSVGRGFNLSVLFMMAMPFFVASSIVVGLILIGRSKENQNLGPSDKEHTPNHLKEETEH
ncbi:MAG: hypothetical protein ACE5IY_19075 [bacterium]